MHYIDVSDGTTISCPKYIVTEFESFSQVKILEKKGDNLGVGNIDNIAAFVTCEPE